jgi:Ricin-type beta-trefoil lectin domain-like
MMAPEQQITTSSQASKDTTMRKIVLLTAVLGVVGMAVPLAAQAMTPKSAPGKCLDDTNWSRSPGTRLQLWACTGGSNQLWDQVSAGSDWGGATYIYKNVYSGLCVDVLGDSSTPGTSAVQWYCNANDKAEKMYEDWQNWIWGFYMINDGTNNCLDDWYANASNGARADFYPCNGTVAQQWNDGQ